jgi:hypothetical protein
MVPTTDLGDSCWYFIDILAREAYPTVLPVNNKEHVIKLKPKSFSKAGRTTLNKIPGAK